jgi:outer membrane scaffolding protein for murein synthesis (MipA/OmpV family)
MTSTRRLPRALALALLPFTAIAAIAQGEADPPPSAASTGRPLWEIGGVALGVSQQAYPGSSRQVHRGLALPFAVYRGRFFRADNDGIGVRPVKTPLYELDISAAGSFGSSANDDPVRRGMPSIGTLVEFGPRLKVNLGPAPLGGRWRLDLPLRGVLDLSHQLKYRGAVFQPGITWSRRPGGGWIYGVGASVLLADERLARSFYEVQPRYATATRPAYAADGGLLSTRLSAFAAKDITRDLTLFGFARVDSVAGAANRASPLVRDTTGTSVGLGVSWTWWRSQRLEGE